MTHKAQYISSNPDTSMALTSIVALIMFIKSSHDVSSTQSFRTSCQSASYSINPHQSHKARSKLDCSHSARLSLHNATHSSQNLFRVICRRNRRNARLTARRCFLLSGPRSLPYAGLQQGQKKPPTPERALCSTSMAFVILPCCAGYWDSGAEGLRGFSGTRKSVHPYRGRFRIRRKHELPQ